MNKQLKEKLMKDLSSYDALCGKLETLRKETKSAPYVVAVSKIIDLVAELVVSDDERKAEITDELYSILS